MTGPTLHGPGADGDLSRAEFARADLRAAQQLREGKNGVKAPDMGPAWLAQPEEQPLPL